MRTRLRRRLLLKKIIAGLFLAAAIPLAAGGLLWAMPQISGIVARAGVISAGLALPEGGLALLQGFGQQEEELPSQVSTETHSASSENSELQEESQLSSEPIQEESVSEPEPEPEPYVAEENRATLIHKTYTTAPSDIYIPLENGYIKNCTSCQGRNLSNRFRIRRISPFPMMARRFWLCTPILRKATFPLRGTTTIRP